MTTPLAFAPGDGTARNASGRLICRVFLTLVAAVGLYVVTADWFRGQEAGACVRVLGMVGLEGAHFVSPNLIQVFPPHQAGFTVEVTPSCSALASMVSVGFLATLIPAPRTVRLLPAAGIAVFLIFAGNLVRITASLGVGYVSGAVSLTLFHDWVGSVFGFAYILFGFMLLLRFLLPRSTSDPAVAGVGHHRG